MFLDLIAGGARNCWLKNLALWPCWYSNSNSTALFNKEYRGVEGMGAEIISKSGQSGELPKKWQTKPHGVAVGRYTDPEFQKLEHEKLWSKVWQVACRVDAVPQPNDYTVYDIGDRSAVIVRVDENTIKAHHNFCPHRGTTLAEGQGTFPSGNIICPFHGWRWNTSGENEYVLERQEFKKGKLEDCDVALKEIHCVEYQGMVFISFAETPESFEDFIEPAREVMEMMVVGEMRNYWWKKIDISANWKVAQEAFFEGYHVPATHPQLEPAAADYLYGESIEGDFDFSHANVAYDAFENGHGRFYAGKPSVMQGNVRQKVSDDPIETMAARLQLLVDGMDAQVLQPDIELVRSLKSKGIPEGSTVGAEYAKAQYADAAAKNRPMPAATPEAIAMWGGELVLFPNIMLLFHAGNMMMYRAMPVGNDPNRCTFEIMSTRTLPDYAPRTRAEVIPVTDMFDPEQVYEIPQQDLGNIPRMQRGMRTGAMKQNWLASYHEKLILNMHQELDQYLVD